MATQLEKLSIECADWGCTVRALRITLDADKDLLKAATANLRESKRVKARHERELKYAKLMVAKLDRKIRALPARVRKWGRNNFDKVWKNIEDGTYEGKK